MLITYEKTLTLTEEREVAFPLYLKRWDSTDWSSWTTYHRFNAAGLHETITITQQFRDNAFEYEFQTEKINVQRELGQYLSDEYEASTQAEFADAIDQCRKALAVLG